MGDNTIELSYIITTFNKLNYLKITLPSLIEACKKNEEIVVIDGGSSDGTKEYLENLYANHKIHVFISEKDFGEAHGYNKALLIAKGELIKIISDDDIYAFDEIQKCKKFMLENEEIDLLASNVIQVNLLSGSKTAAYYIKNQELDFIDWKNGNRPNTFFSGLTLMIRKTSLPLLGLLNNYFKMVDLEYCVRVTSIKSKIAYYTNALVVSTINADSNSKLFVEKYEKEQIKVSLTYEYFNTYLSNQRYYNPYSFKDSFKYLTNMFFNKLLRKNKFSNANYLIETDLFNEINVSSFEKIVNTCSKLIVEQNNINQGSFIIKN